MSGEELETPTIVATDASMAAVQRGEATIAVVCSDGRYAVKEVTADNITTAEILAIHNAYRRFEKPVIVHTDSQDAIDILNSDKPYYDVKNRKITRYLKVLRGGLKYGDLRVAKVKGHSGDPLNETADRLAVRYRRVIQLDLPKSSQDEIYASIVKENLGIEGKNMNN